MIGQLYIYVFSSYLIKKENNEHHKSTLTGKEFLVLNLNDAFNIYISSIRRNLESCIYGENSKE